MIIIENKSDIFTITFNRKVLKHLNCKADDYLVIMQSLSNQQYFTIIKAEKGYRIKRFKGLKKTYFVSINFKYKGLKNFEKHECTYYMKRNNIIRIILK
jgi:hypothetical protein